jgi:hypothetical protein
MNNIVNYSFGFLEGVQKGKKIFLDKLGKSVIEALAQYVDVQARSNPKALHHVYEWNQTGSPTSRLFNLNYTVSNLGLSLNSTFRQSRTVSENMTVPFYNKAKIMEEGVAVTINPKRASALRFEVDGQEVYTSREVRVDNPGGQTQGQFNNVISNFFGVYFRQSFLNSSGLLQYFKSPQVYKKNLGSAKRGGRSLGLKTGYQWVANAGRMA